MIETIPLPVHNEIYARNISKDSYCTKFNLRINEMIKNSAFLFEKKSKLIMRELQNLNTEYLTQLHYLSDYISNKSKYNKIQIKPRDKSITKRNQEKKNFQGEVKNNNIPMSCSTKTGYSEIFKEPSSTNHSMTLNSKRRLINVSGGFNNNKITHKKKNSDTHSIVSTSNNSVIKKNQSPLRNNKMSYNNKVPNSITHKNTKGAYRSADKKVTNNLNINFSDNSEKIKKKVDYDHDIPHFNYQFDSNIENKYENNCNNIFNNLVAIREDRKFSIMDLKSELQKNEFSNLTNSNKISEINEYATLNSKSQIKSKLEKSNVIEKLKDKHSKVFYILANSKVVNIKERLIFSTINRSIYQNIKPKEVIKDYYFLINKSIANIQMEINENKINQNLIDKNFHPSKTAQNSLNFLTKEIEENIIQSNTEEVKELRKLICILLNQNFDSSINSGEILMQNIFSKYGVQNLKSLFLNVIYLNVYIKNSITISQIFKFNEIIFRMPQLIKPAELSKINFPASYISFAIKEIYEYLNLQNTENGLIILKWKKRLDHLHQMRKQEEKIRRILNI